MSRFWLQMTVTEKVGCRVLNVNRQPLNGSRMGLQAGPNRSEVVLWGTPKVRVWR